MDFLNKLEELLKTNKNFVDNKNELIKIKVIEVARNINNENHKELLKLLLNNQEMKKEFFYNIDDIVIFNKEHFVNYLKNKQFLSDCYTEFEQSIGFNVKEQMENNVVLNWPFKDCILEGGQATEDNKKNEIFFNEILAKDEISRLLEPKVLTNFEKWTIDGKQEFTGFTRDKEKNKARDLPENTITDNLMIKGNNLLALHTLQEEFRGKVKLIYIDPPYNTDSDANTFKYNNNFNHSTWLTFMKNRLKIAKELLKDDGIIIIDIDHFELFYLGVLCDEVFDKSNRLGILAVQHNPGGRDNEFFANSHENKLVYAKNKSLAKIYSFDLSEEEKNRFNKEDEYGKYSEMGLQRTGDGSKREDRPNLFFPIFYNEKTDEISLEKKEGFIEILPIDDDGIERRWRWGKAKIEKECCKELIVKKVRDKYKVYTKNRLLNDTGKKPKTFWFNSQYSGMTGTNAIKELFGDKVFNYPKSPYMVKDTLEMASQPQDIVLDFFAGSGTTADVAHKMNRQWITIEQMDYIETITKERLKKVIGNKTTKDGDLLEELEFDNGGISKNVNWQGGGEFVYFELAKYNQNFVELLEKAETKEEVINIFNSICEKGFPKYNIDIKKLNENIEEFKNFDLDRMKKDVYDILNKNMLYVPKSLMKDSKYNISEKDIELNKSFYSKGI